MKVDGVTAEFVNIGGIRMDEPKKYDVIIDRISQDIQFYRAYLKNAALQGTIVVNNPFWWTADDKFFNYALAHKMGVAIPPTVILPHNKHPEGTTDRSMRNLMYPLNWQEIFDYVGFPAFLKPYSGGGWKHVYKVHSPEEFFHHYNQTGDLCMTLQRGVEFDEYYRCYVVGQEKVHIMKYDPKAPHHERYVKGNPPPSSPALRDRIEKDALTLVPGSRVRPEYRRVRRGRRSSLRHRLPESRARRRDHLCRPGKFRLDRERRGRDGGQNGAAAGRIRSGIALGEHS